MEVRTDWLNRCPACGFLKSNLTPGAGADVGGVEALRRANFKRLLDRVERIRRVKGAQILEIGCSTGLFLEAAAAHGADIEAIEPDRNAGETARGKGFSVVDGFFPESADATKFYDIIIFNDVFEHLPDPVGALQATEALLLSGGLAIFNLPSASGFLYRIADLMSRYGMLGILERLWQRGQASPHLTYFTPENLERFIRRYSSLVTIDQFPLMTMMRRGLLERVFSTETGVHAYVLFIGLYAMTFVQQVLPADIQVLIVRKPSP